MIRIAAYVAGIAVIAGLLCTPALGTSASGAGGDLPWPARWEPVLGTSAAGLGLVLVLGVTAAVLAGHLGARVRERPPGYAATWAPPEGIGPAQAVYLTEQRVPRRALVGTLLHAADRGAVTIGRADDGWRLTAISGGAAAVDEVTQELVRRLTGPDGTFTAIRGDAPAGERLEEVIGHLEGSVRDWGRRSGNVSRTGLGGLATVLILLGLALVALCAVVRPFGMAMVGIVPGALVVAGASMAVAGAGRRRTRAGRRLWSRVAGFERVMRAPSSKQRFDFAGREAHYPAYVPWAVAFGCSRQWAQKYRTEVGSEPPVPGYLPAYAGAHTADHVDAVVHDITATLGSALSAYAAARRPAPNDGFGVGRASW